MDKQESDFNIACSDDENYGFSQNEDTGKWEPSVDVIKNLYELLGKGEKLELEWKCAGRRAPTPAQNTAEQVPESKPEETSKEEEDKQNVTEFDFDDLSAEDNPVTPARRTPGSNKTPKSSRRVARMDKIMDDLFRHKKINEKGTRSGGQSPARAGDRLSPRVSPRASPRGSPKPSHLALSSAGDSSNKGNSSPKGNASPKKS